jgi:hypothetical protein
VNDGIGALGFNPNRQVAVYRGWWRSAPSKMTPWARAGGGVTMWAQRRVAPSVSRCPRPTRRTPDRSRRPGPDGYDGGLHLWQRSAVLPRRDRPGGGVTAHDFGRPGFPMQEVADVAEPTSIHREPSA